MGGWVDLQKLITDLDMRNDYKGGVWVYEAYDVKNIREKIRYLLLRRKKIFFYIYDVIHRKKKNAPPITTNDMCRYETIPLKYEMTFVGMK
jgi:hypothetical protein